jgi:hypothetical protein
VEPQRTQRREVGAAAAAAVLQLLCWYPSSTHKTRQNDTGPSQLDDHALMTLSSGSVGVARRHNSICGIMDQNWPMSLLPALLFAHPYTCPLWPAVCQRWEAGHCRFGDRCNFAHGDDELRQLPPRHTSGGGSSGGGGRGRGRGPDSGYREEGGGAGRGGGGGRGQVCRARQAGRQLLLAGLGLAGQYARTSATCTTPMPVKFRRR